MCSFSELSDGSIDGDGFGLLEDMLDLQEYLDGEIDAIRESRSSPKKSSGAMLLGGSDSPGWALARATLSRG